MPNSETSGHPAQNRPPSNSGPNSAPNSASNSGPHERPRTPPAPGHWPRPPAALPASMIDLPPGNARVTVAGIVILRQRPGTAKGVIFLTLEDETGIVNVIVWRKLYEAFRRAVISGRMLRVTGRVQRDSGVTHVIAEQIEDISAMLDQLPALGDKSGDAPPHDGGAGW